MLSLSYIVQKDPVFLFFALNTMKDDYGELIAMRDMVILCIKMYQLGSEHSIYSSMYRI